MKKVFLFLACMFVAFTTNAQTYSYDVNHDGEISIKDIMCIVNKILGIPNPGEELKSYLVCPDENHPHLIDLGLPSSTKWACCNVDATTPDGHGGYYAWGETETKKKYSQSTYKYYQNGSYVNLGSDIARTEYDVANVKWGDKWQMPSYYQQSELKKYCSYEWTTKNGVKGIKFTSKTNGASIFLPASGYYSDSNLNGIGTCLNYSSSTQDSSESYSNLVLGFDYEGAFWSDGRHYGHTVRPVSYGNSTPTLLLSSSSLSIAVGEQGTVSITSGSGNYTAHSSSTAVATATISNNKVIITGFSAGNASITVTDAKSNQTATIDVTVFPVINIVGTWYVYEADQEGLDGIWTFNSDNTGTIEEFYHGESEGVDKITYVFSGTRLTIYYVGGKDDSSVFDINIVSEDEFTWTDGHDTLTFVRQGIYPILQLSSAILNLFVSNQEVVDIISGSGSYTVTSSNTNVATASLSGTTITITGKSAGTAVVTVKDNTSGITKEISVKVVVPIVLSQSSVEVNVDQSTTVNITSGSGSYSVTSSNTNVATASLSGTTITITGKSAGTAVVTVKDNTTGNAKQISVTVKASQSSYLTCPDNNHPHMIDLGLPSGTKWACCNVGADKPEAYGGYYAWGETEEKATYNWSTYIHCDGSQETCHNLGSDIAGTQYDVAHVKWGGSWVMPSYDQQRELLDNCTHEWTTVNGVKGRKFISKTNGGSIFLPAAGYRWNGGLYGAGSLSYYWSSTPNGERTAYGLTVSSGYARWYYYGRGYGQGVRPVVRN